MDIQTNTQTHKQTEGKTISSAPHCVETISSAPHCVEQRIMIKCRLQGVFYEKIDIIPCNMNYSMCEKSPLMVFTMSAILCVCRQSLKNNWWFLNMNPSLFLGKWQASSQKHEAPPIPCVNQLYPGLIMAWGFSHFRNWFNFLVVLCITKQWDFTTMWNLCALLVITFGNQLEERRDGRDVQCRNEVKDKMYSSHKYEVRPLLGVHISHIKSTKHCT